MDFEHPSEPGLRGRLGVSGGHREQLTIALCWRDPQWTLGRMKSQGHRLSGFRLLSRPLQHVDDEPNRAADQPRRVDSHTVTKGRATTATSTVVLSMIASRASSIVTAAPLHDPQPGGADAQES